RWPPWHGMSTLTDRRGVHAPSGGGVSTAWSLPRMRGMRGGVGPAAVTGLLGVGVVIGDEVLTVRDTGVGTAGRYGGPAGPRAGGARPRAAPRPGCRAPRRWRARAGRGRPRGRSRLPGRVCAPAAPPAAVAPGGGAARPAAARAGRAGTGAAAGPVTAP